MRTLWVLLCLPLLFSCGYNLRGSRRPFFESNEIRTIFVEPVKNNSYKAGAEIVVYNALRKAMARGGYVRIIDQKETADARLSAQVMDVTSAPSAPIPTTQVLPTGTGRPDVYVASSYVVTLRVQFQLRKTQSSNDLWSNELTRAKSFPATTYKGTLGSTSALINESDYERTLADLAVNIVTDAEESMNSTF